MRDLEYNINARDRSGPGFDSARNRARAFNGELDRTAQSLNLTALAARAFAGAFTLTAVAEFGRYVNTVINDVSTLVDLSDKFGVGIEDLQRMQYGFGLAGVEAGNIDQILSQWSKRIGEAHTAGGRLADILKANGVALTDGNGQLRSSVDLMRDYADLVANAGSEQEQALLTTLAFGKAGQETIQALKDGASGFDDLMSKAEEAGGVLDEQLARRLEEIGDEMDTMWYRFEIGAKTAIGNAVVFMADLRGEFGKLNADYEQRLQAVGRGAQLGVLAFSTETEASRAKTGSLGTTIDQRVSGAFDDPQQMTESDRKLAAELRSRFGPKTIIGGELADNDSRAGSAKVANEQVSAYDRVIKKLNEEKAILGLTDIARRVAIEQQRAGVDATTDEGQAIAALVQTIETQEAAYKSAAEASEFMKDNFRQSFSEMIPQIETGNQALDGFINRLSQAALDAAFFGSGPLAGLFGGGGGLFTSMFGGGRAIGGGVNPWSDYLVGENGPEIVRIGSRGGRVGEAGDSETQSRVSHSSVYNIDARGADQAAVARIERGLQERDRTERKRVAVYGHESSIRGTRS